MKNPAADRLDGASGFIRRFLPGGKPLAIRYKAARWFIMITCYLIFFSIIFMILFPLFEKAAMIFQSRADLADNTVKYIPQEPTLDTLKRTLTAMDYWQVLGRTAALATLVSVIQVFVTAFIAYGLSRFNFLGKKLFFALIVLTLVIPPQIIMCSLYLHFYSFDFLGIIAMFNGGSGIRMINTIWPFVIMSLTGLGIKNGLYVYIYRQFFRNLPAEFEEAAYIDGASVMRTFFTIMLPNARTIMVTVFLFSFSWQWTDSNITPLISMNFIMMPSALVSLETYMMNQLEPVFRVAIMNTGSLLAIIPLILLFLAGQRFFVQGIERSGIVG